MFGSDFSTERAEPEGLKKLGWLVGRWHAVRPGTTESVDLSCEWSAELSEEFLFCRATTHLPVGNIEEVFFMGLDPSMARIVDTRFDNGGGVRQTIWSAYESGGQEAGLLLGHQSGSRGDGAQVMSHERLEYLDESSFRWDSLCRKKDGTPDVIPELREIVFQRTG